MDVVGLGVSTLDVLFLLEAFPAGEGVQRAASSDVQGGGPVATAVVTVARLGGRACMLDRLGDDWRAEHIRADFRRHGVVTDHLRTTPGSTSSLASILVRRRDGARAIAYAPGTCGELRPEDVPVDVVAGARILHVNGRHLQACLAAVQVARRAGTTVSFDGGAGRYRPALRALVPLSDVCIVAREFGAAYTGRSDPRAAARTLGEEGPGLVVVTDGARGSWICPRGQTSFHQPAFPMPDPVDTTGAGDAYHGGFLHALARGRSPREAARLASAVAALSTRVLGGRAGLPTLAEAEGLAGEDTDAESGPGTRGAGE